MSESTTQRKNVGAEDFIRHWQTANSVSDVVKVTGLKLGTVQQRAMKLRKNGVPLKQFSKGRVKLADDKDRLAKLVKLAEESLKNV